MTKCVFFFQDPRVVDAMLPFMLSHYGNAHSRTHSYGWESEQAVEKARQVIAFFKGKSCLKVIESTSNFTNFVLFFSYSKLLI